MRKVLQAHIKNPILKYLRKTGDLDNCASCLKTKTINQDTIKRAINPNDKRYYVEAFAVEITEAMEHYGKTNQPISENDKVKQGLIQQVEAVSQSGESSSTDFEYFTEGVLARCVKRKNYRKPGVLIKLLEMAFPKPSQTQEGLLMFASNFMTDFAATDDIPAEVKPLVIAYLGAWIKEKTIELQVAGKRINLLNEERK